MQPKMRYTFIIQVSNVRVGDKAITNSEKQSNVQFLSSARKIVAACVCVCVFVSCVFSISKTNTKIAIFSREIMVIPLETETKPSKHTHTHTKPALPSIRVDLGCSCDLSNVSRIGGLHTRTLLHMWKAKIVRLVVKHEGTACCIGIDIDRRAHTCLMRANHFPSGFLAISIGWTMHDIIEFAPNIERNRRQTLFRAHSTPMQLHFNSTCNEIDSQARIRVSLAGRSSLRVPNAA